MALLLAGCDGGDGGSAATPSSRPSAASATPSAVRVLEHVCDAYGYRPREILVACGDGNVRLERLRWATWTTTRAVATGVWEQNDCEPDCARGTFHDYPVRLTLSQPMDKEGRRIFGTAVAEFTGRRPAYPSAATGREVLMTNGCAAGPVCR